MSLLNLVVTTALGVVLRPLQLVSPLVGIGLVSLATAIAMLLVVRATSDQARIKAARSAMYAAMLEMRLFSDDLRAVLRAQWALLSSNASYVRASLVPMLWLVVPLVLLVAQLEPYYGYRAISPGQSVLVTARLRDDVEAGRALTATLASPPGIHAAVPGVWFPAAHEVVWRLSPPAAGEYELHVRVDAEEFVKNLQVSDLVVPASPSRVGPAFVDQLRYPTERALPAASVVRAITVAYPEREIEVAGWRLNWMVLYGVLSILFALMLKRAFGVTL